MKLLGTEISPLLVVGAGVGAYLLLRPTPPATPPAAPAPAPPATPADPRFADGAYLQVAGNTTVWRLSQGLKRRFQDYESALVDGVAPDYSNVFPVTTQDIGRFPDGAPMPIRRFAWRNDGTFVQLQGNPTIWYMMGGRKHRLPDWETFLAMGGRADRANVVFPIAALLEQTPEGDPMPSVHGVHLFFS